MGADIGHHIGGHHTSGEWSRAGEIYNPATGEVIRRVAFATTAEVDSAVRSAREALPQWAGTPPAARANILARFGRLVRDETERLVALITEENGKTQSEARGELERGIEIIEFASGIESHLKGDFSAQVRPRTDSWSIRQPLGVCVGITPYNFPAMVPLWMFPIALACGNTFVLKPSERVPSASLRLADLLMQAGIPRGVFNIVNGSEETAHTLMIHPLVAGVSFVGSSSVAREAYRTAAQHGKRVQALGSAKNHLVVMPDADLDTVVQSLAYAAFGAAGQRCMAVSVLVMVGDADSVFIEKLTSRMARLNVGPGTHADTEVGPLISREQREKVHTYVALGLEEGARLVLDGRDIVVSGHEGGFFTGPCIFDAVRPDMRIYKEEIFGPVLLVLRAENFADALTLVNAHQYGNGAAIFTRNGDTARTFANAVHAGMVGVNVPVPVPPAPYSFGGWKSSQFGGTGMHGPEGVRFYTRLKTITSHW